MLPITLTATIDENHRLTLDLPDDIPAGEVEVIIRQLPTSQTNGQPAPSGEMTRDELREKLRAAGLLMEGNFAPLDAEELSAEEESHLADLAGQGRPLSEIIIEEREERF